MVLGIKTLFVAAPEIQQLLFQIVKWAHKMIKD
jgi:hypothetical protein